MIETGFQILAKESISIHFVVTIITSAKSNEYLLDNGVIMLKQNGMLNNMIVYQYFMIFLIHGEQMVFEYLYIS